MSIYFVETRETPESIPALDRSATLRDAIHQAVTSFARVSSHAEASSTIYLTNQDIPDAVGRVSRSNAPGATYSVNVYTRVRDLPMTGVLDSGERYRIYQF